MSDTISKINIVFLLNSQEHPSQDFPFPSQRITMSNITVLPVTVIVTDVALLKASPTNSVQNRALRE